LNYRPYSYLFWGPLFIGTQCIVTHKRAKDQGQMSLFATAHTTSCSTLLETMRLSCTVFEL